MSSRSRFFALFLVACSIGMGGCRCAGGAGDGSGSDTVGPADCPAFTAAGRLPATPEEAAAQKEKGARWSNKEIRARYVCWVTGIGALNTTWKAEGLPAEERAKRAYQTRHNARMTARAMMANEAEVKLLNDRDRDKYGHPDGPTYEWLVQKAKEKGLADDAVFEEIISSAQRTDPATNKAFGL